MSITIQPPKSKYRPQKGDTIHYACAAPLEPTGAVADYGYFDVPEYRCTACGKVLDSTAYDEQGPAGSRYHYDYLAYAGKLDGWPFELVRPD